MVVNALFYAKEGMTQRDICVRTFQSKQTVNLIIRNLLSKAQVTVEERKENKREKLVRMTDAGRACYEKAVRHITWAEDAAMARFSPAEQKQLIDLSRTFTKNLKELIHQETGEL